MHQVTFPATLHMIEIASCVNIWVISSQRTAPGITAHAVALVVCPPHGVHCVWLPGLFLSFSATVWLARYTGQLLYTGIQPDGEKKNHLLFFFCGETTQTDWDSYYYYLKNGSNGQGCHCFSWHTTTEYLELKMWHHKSIKTFAYFPSNISSPKGRLQPLLLMALILWHPPSSSIDLTFATSAWSENYKNGCQSLYTLCLNWLPWSHCGAAESNTVVNLSFLAKSIKHCITNKKEKISHSGGLCCTMFCSYRILLVINDSFFKIYLKWKPTFFLLLSFTKFE